MEVTSDALHVKNITNNKVDACTTWIYFDLSNKYNDLAK